VGRWNVGRNPASESAASTRHSTPTLKNAARRKRGGGKREQLRFPPPRRKGESPAYQQSTRSKATRKGKPLRPGPGGGEKTLVFREQSQKKNGEKDEIRKVLDRHGFFVKKGNLAGVINSSAFVIAKKLIKRTLPPSPSR